MAATSMHQLLRRLSSARRSTPRLPQAELPPSARPMDETTNNQWLDIAHTSTDEIPLELGLVISVGHDVVFLSSLFCR